jgi:hypothetical protein
MHIYSAEGNEAVREMSHPFKPDTEAYILFFFTMYWDVDAMDPLVKIKKRSNTFTTNVFLLLTTFTVLLFFYSLYCKRP